MTPNIESMYHQMGGLALQAADDLTGTRLLLWAEVAQGAHSVYLYYEDGTGRVRQKFAPFELGETVYDFWIAWKAQPQQREWRVMEYIINNGKFSIDFVYPDQLGPDEDEHDLVEPAIERIFGKIAIDYSRAD